MEKTTYYQLNKPEPTDPMRVADFNENADKVDAALNSVRNEAVSLSAQVRAEAANALAAYKTTNDAAVASLNTAVSTKAEQSTVDALSTAVAAGVKLQTGTYKGNGKYGSSNPNTLTFDFTPKFLMIWSTAAAYQAVTVTGANFAVQYDFYCWTCTVDWSGNTVTWHSSDSAGTQMNESGKTYYYLALG